MLFRYDFKSKLDLSRFTKQASHYIKSMPEISYQLCIFDYKINSDIKKISNEDLYDVRMSIFEIKRDKDGEIFESKTIYPMHDIRFQDMKDIVSLLPDENSCVANFQTNNPEQIVDKISRFIKMLNKLNNLKAFF
jgi:hypothetical protein